METTLYELITDVLADGALCVIQDNNTNEVIGTVIKNHVDFGIENLSIEDAERIVVSHSVKQDEDFTDVEVNFIYVR